MASAHKKLTIQYYYYTTNNMSGFYFQKKLLILVLCRVIRNVGFFSVETKYLKKAIIDLCKFK